MEKLAAVELRRLADRRSAFEIKDHRAIAGQEYALH